MQETSLLGRSPREGIGYPLKFSWASLIAQTVKYLKFRPGFDPWVGKIPWRRAWKPTPVFLPGESPWTEETVGLQSMGSQRVGHGKWLSTAQHSLPLNIQCKDSQSKQPLDPMLFNYRETLIILYVLDFEYLSIFFSTSVNFSSVDFE